MPRGLRDEESIETLDPQGRASLVPYHGQFGPKGQGWQDTCKGPLDIATHYIYKLWASWFQRRRFLMFSHYKSIETLDPRGGASIDPRGMVGRIYVENH